ncbi:MAG: ATP-grasp domain-containing protein [Wenzhouxiangellaceae bacterium]
MLKGCVVIVEPEGAGVELAATFRRYNRPVVVLKRAAAHDEDPVENEATTGDADLLIAVSPNLDTAAVARQLRRYAPIAVAPGSERGVPLADELSQHLGLATNEVGLRAARYDKYAMARAAADAGLRIPWQACIASDEDLQQLLSTDVHWPVVIKPVASMGSEGVTLCADATALLTAFRRLRAQTNRLGRMNQKCLVQQWLQGTEYAIDTVSIDGRHRLCAIWRYRKTSDRILGLVPFTSKQLLPARGVDQKVLMAYARQLLGAVGISHGPAHMELLIDEHGVQLMELGARLHGGVAAMDLARRCTGRSQTEICATAYVDPDTFIAGVDSAYELTQRGEIMLLLPAQDGLYADASTVARVRQLPAVVQVHINDAGVLGRIAGMVMLQHDSQTVIDQTRQLIRDLEQSSLYRAEPEFTVAPAGAGP